jgi:hypothetical protein
MLSDENLLPFFFSRQDTVSISPLILLTALLLSLGKDYNTALSTATDINIRTFETGIADSRIFFKTLS